MQSLLVAALAFAMFGPLTAPAAWAAPSISTSSVSSKPVGIDTYVWGTAQGAAGRRVWTEAQLADGSWARSQMTVANASGGYSIKLTYGQHGAGQYQWRVAAETSSGIVRSDPFTLTRTGWVRTSSVASKRVGEQTHVWGTAFGTLSRRVWTEAQLPDGTWARSQMATANASGGYNIELTYGRYSPGTYRWRVAAETPVGVVRSDTFTLIRKGHALNLARWDSWIRIAQCESGNRWNINTGNGYYGGLQFDYPTWHSVNGGDFAQYPHQATREEQITVANRLYAKRGFQPWGCRP